MSFDSNSLWQDRQVLFDCSKSEFIFRQGEETYKTMSNIEDLKGNNELGTFIFTNLRLIWYNNKNPKINQTIGYNCIENLEKKTSDSMMTGQSIILTIFCRSDKNKYELTYRSSSESGHDPYINLSNILKLYEQGRMYREVKQNNENICNQDNKNLKLLKDEKVIDKNKNIYYDNNNNNDDNNYGTLYKTNIRLIWINDKNCAINLSIPWIMISSIKGESHQDFGNNAVRIKLTRVYNNAAYVFCSKEVINKEYCDILYKIMIKNLENPILSISLRKGDEGEAPRDKLKEKIGKIADMVYGQEEISDKNEDDQAGMIYLINEGRNKQNNINNIEFSKELGIACEKLPDKVTISDLWKIIK